MPKGPLCRTNLARQSAGKPKTKKPKTTDPTGQTQNQKPKFWFWFLVFQKTKNQKKHAPFGFGLACWVCFFVFQKNKNQILVWFLVLGLIFLFFWLLVFGLVPGVCIFLLVGFWFFAGGVATYISSSSHKRTLQKPSLVDLSF